ncbi:response regulator transcription factor [Coralliovum pocilloporae]|uniref:response regulator transcription factor n=1 Tax=Coralliovum pocilloporae TaxID=3066369 RepID=UPI0033078372
MSDRLIHIVDDDLSVCDALKIVFELDGFEAEAFTDGEQFLKAQAERRPDCVILDVHMPGRSGIDILNVLNAPGYQAPIFIISGQGDIPMAVAAMKHGATDFIEKPFDATDVVNRIRAAIETRREESLTADLKGAFPGSDKLTQRELDVVEAITDGLSNREAGEKLSISPRTVEVHRARIMDKLGARNAADLVRIVLSR